MSRSVSIDRYDGELPPPICDTCESVIVEDNQQCDALDEGVYAP